MAQRRRGPDLGGMPHLQEQDQTAHRNQRGADIDDPRVDEIRDQVLRHGKRDSGHQDRRPYLHHAPPARECPDQPGGHDQREKRQLPPDHRTEEVGVEPRHAGKPGDRCAEGAIGDRRGIGNQRQAGGGERREAEADQDRGGHRDGCPKARGALEERAERECDQQQLQAAVGRDAADRPLQDRKGAGRDGQPVHEDDVEDDPADREEARDRAENGGADRQAPGHREQQDCHEDRGDERDDRRDMCPDCAGRDQHQEGDDRDRRGNRRQDFAVKRIVDLLPHGAPPSSRRFRLL